MHSGTVTFARYLSPGESLAGQWWISGNVIAIEGRDENGNTIWTAYGHGTSDTMRVQVGEQVEAGQLLMMSGTTGYSTGIHLHLAMQINGGWVNPSAYLGGD
jgi:murein DD-endopeptidase MepM/ murein hydrolase activator NlpD